MDFKESVAYVNNLRIDPAGKKPGWKNKRHFATYTWRNIVPPKISRDSHLKDESALAVIEIVTTVEIPGTENFNGIIQVDELGIWYSANAITDISDPSERHGLVPWHLIQTVVLHKA